MHKSLIFMKKVIFSILLSFTLSAAAQQPADTNERMQALGLVDIQSVDPTIQVSLALTRPDNITGKVLYTDLQNAYLHPQAALALKKAQAALKRLRPDLSLKVYDAARPMSVQARLYAVVAGTDKNIYISNPKSGGDQHNYGLAVDVTLCDAETGDSLAMGSRIGSLADESRVGMESHNAETGKLTSEMAENRELLRRVMAIGGFKALRTEWWHFNFRTRSEAKANFKPIK